MMDDLISREAVLKEIRFPFSHAAIRDAIRALPAVQVGVKPDCCDICRGEMFAETADGKGWRCVECKAIWLREPQPDPMTDPSVVALVEAAKALKPEWAVHRDDRLAYRVVNAGDDAWHKFQAALRQIGGAE